MRSEGLVAILAAVLIIGAAVGYLVGGSSVVPAKSTLRTTYTIFTSPGTSPGLALGVTTNSSIKSSENETIVVSLTNLLPRENNVSYKYPQFTFTSGLSSASPTLSIFLLPVPEACSFVPFGQMPLLIAIYNQTGAPMQLNAVSPGTITCVGNGDNYRGHLSAFQVVLKTFSVGGSWKSAVASEPWLNATFVPFSPGTYTVYAFDPWKQVALGSFTVSA